MRYVNIVHLSDLHLAADGVESQNQNRILSALARDLKSHSRTHLKPDIIIFSGDLSNAGDPESLGVCRSVLYKLLEETNLPPERLIVTPGNHDASQAEAEKSGDLIIETRNNVRASINGPNTLLFDDNFINHVDKKFSNFVKFANTFGQKPVYENAFCSVSVYESLRLSVISINTATLSTAGSKALESDDGRLAFPDLVLDDAFNFVPDSHAVAVVGHHPLGMMTEQNANALKTLLCKRANAYLFGHMHLAAPENVQSAAGECKFLQSGALYMGRDRWNGYHIVSVIPTDTNIRVTTRKWHESRLEFGVSTDLSDDGTLYLPSSGKSVWDEVADRPNYEKLEQWRAAELVPALAQECSQSLTTQPLSEIYVDPEFERDVYVETVNGRELRNEPETLEFERVSNWSPNLIISAQSETGKTALVRHWAQLLASRSAFEPGWSVPIILNYPQLKSYTGGIESAVLRRIPNLSDGLRARSILSAGLATIFVDDMKLEETREKVALCEFMEKYPDCRYILLTSSIFFQAAGISPVISKFVHFETLRIKKLKRGQLLSLIEKHGTNDPVKADRLLDRLLTEANSLNVPLTPVSSTFLIQIFTERSARPVINRASLLERYIEISLEKFAPEEILSGSFDFHNKSDLLSDIAERMCREEDYEWSEKKALGTIESYLAKYELNYSAMSLLNYFIGARILETVDQKIAFRLKAFLEYFAGRRMAEDSKFRAWVLDEIRYLQFEGEISCYAAMTRKDEDWIDLLVDRFLDHSKRVWKGSPLHVRDGSILEDLTLPRGDSTEEEVFAIERRVLAENLDDEGRRELLNSSSSPEYCNGKAINRPDIREPGEVWTTQLNLLSAMVKHMELIPKDRKRAVLKLVIDGWIKVLANSVGVVPALAKEKSITLNGIRYEIQFPPEMTIGEITRRILVSLPISIFRIIHQIMGTDKLELQLAQGIGDDVAKTPAREQLMRVGLLSLLGNEGIADKLASVGDTLRGREYLSEVFLRQMYELAVRYRLPDGELRKVKRLAADMTMEMEAVPTSKRAKRRDEVIRNLTKSRLIVGMDPNTSGDLKKLPSRKGS